MRLRNYGRLFLTTILAGGAWSADAQSTAKPEFVVKFSSVARYDSNLARVAAGQESARGLVREDYSVRPSIDLRIVRPIGGIVATLDGGVAYNFYRRNTILNREQMQFAGNVVVPVSLCRVQLDGSYSRRQSDLGEVNLLNVVGSQAVRNVETTQLYGARGQCGRATGISLGMGLERKIADNSNSLRAFSDNRATTYNGSIGYARPTFGSLSIQASMDEVRYPNRLVIPGSSDRYSAQNVGVRFERQIGQALRGVVAVGYANVDPKAAGVARFKGVTWSADLTVSLGDRFQATIGTSRAVKPTLQSEAVYNVQRQYTLDATYFLSDRLSLGAGAQLSSRRFAGATAVNGPLLTDDRRNSYRAGITYRPSQRIQFSLDGNYDRRDGNGTLYDYSSAGAAFRVSFTL
jgi:hypothetical protein